MPGMQYAKNRYAKCKYAKCKYVKCKYVFANMLKADMLLSIGKRGTTWSLEQRYHPEM